MERSDPFIKNFALLGRFLRQFPEKTREDSGALAPLNNLFYDSFNVMLEREPMLNPWFTPAWLDRALMGIALMLDEQVLHRWVSAYKEIPVEAGKKKLIGLVLAGNIPLVGFHDILCVLAGGHSVQAKPSSKDNRLIRSVADIITYLDAETGKRICLTDGHLGGMDAVIATGSDNSARYFEYYFRDIPHIIRKNRNGVAVLTGRETEKELLALGRDIFTYFGMGCRNVTKLYIPEDYDLKVLLEVLDNFTELSQHNKYANNVDYHRSIYLMNRVEFLDNGITLVKEDSAIASPAGVVFYERYSEIGTVQQQLTEHEEEIQCTVSVHPDIENRIRPGGTQEPMPWDYADGVDTISFLIQLR
ncbi:MAG: acyl-CoA reductase [Bacteroidetes bacterium]|nr:acyl-CoA reductase [Bacteroidota bacterium]